MKVIIQIPCFNEEKSLPTTLADLPRTLPGVDKIEWLIIDDGSRDRTVEVAKKLGVDHVVSFPINCGLAKAFMAGLERGLAEGADIIVNTDADNQYCAADIPKLLQPILEGKAEIVIGARPIKSIESFSPVKKLLQLFGSWVVRVASGTDVPDAPSGFRAISRKAAMQLNVFNEYTYTLETIIQSGQKGFAIQSVDIRTNGVLRPSRLVKSIPSYVRRSIVTIFRIFIVYRPLKFFMTCGAVLFTCGFLLGLRFLYYYVTAGGQGLIQSLILAALFLGAGFALFVIALVADLIAVNRKLLEKNLWHLQKIREHLELSQSRLNK